jgi:ribonuclease III
MPARFNAPGFQRLLTLSLPGITSRLPGCSVCREARTTGQSALARCRGGTRPLLAAPWRRISTAAAVGPPRQRRPARTSSEVVVTRDNLQALESKLMHNFRDKATLAEAMIHSSCAGARILEAEDGKHVPLTGVTSNERYEWLGDKCFDLAVGQFLFRRHPSATEGELTKLSHTLVSRESANRLCLDLGLDTHLICSPTLRANEMSMRIPSRYGNFFECCFGALLLDGGDVAVRKFFERCVIPLLEIFLDTSPDANFRGQLQELLLRHPGFESVDLGNKLKFEEIPLPASASKNQNFFCQGLTLCGNIVAVGSGPTKAKASQDACRCLLERLREARDTEALLKALIR